MVAPGFLQSPSVRAWLDGAEPAWTLLDDASFHGLRRPPHPQDGPIRLSSELTAAEIQASPMASNELILLRAAATEPGLKLTATGNLSRGVVAEMIDRMIWPGFDRDEALQFHKVVNEPDLLQLHFLRIASHSCKLLRRRTGHLVATPLGRELSEPAKHGTLLALLFHVYFWYLDIGVLGRGPLHNWPQNDLGIVLWSLSVAAADWQLPKRLARLCTVPVNGVLDSNWDVGTFAMESRVLTPLTWFGLVELREVETTGSRLDRERLYRKAPLFDRFLSFEVKLEGTAGPRQ